MRWPDSKTAPWNPDRSYGALDTDEIMNVWPAPLQAVFVRVSDQYAHEDQGVRISISAKVLLETGQPTLRSSEHTDRK